MVLRGTMDATDATNATTTTTTTKNNDDDICNNTNATDTIIDVDLMKEIMSVEVEFTSNHEKMMVEKLHEELHEYSEEIARTSYAYWVLSTTNERYGASSSSSTSPYANAMIDQDRARTRMSLREIRRHYLGEGSNHAKTLSRVREMIGLRRRYNIDLLRRAFSGGDGIRGGGGNNKRKNRTETEEMTATTMPDSTSSSSDGSSSTYDDAVRDEAEEEDGGEEENAVDDDDDEAGLIARYRSWLEEEHGRQQLVVIGRDRLGHACLVRSGGRATAEVDADAYMSSCLYALEKAIACSEVLTRGRDPRIRALLDFGNDDHRAKRVPVHVLVPVIKVWGRVYAERVTGIVAFNVPLHLRGLYNVISVLIPRDTKERIRIVSGRRDAIDRVAGELVEPEHAAGCFHSKGKLRSRVDVREYLHEYPFHAVYDKRIDE